MKRFGILFIALLSLCACSNDGPDTPTKIEQPTLLQINENALTVKSTGGEYAFTYVVEGGSKEVMTYTRETIPAEILEGSIVRSVVDTAMQPIL